MTSPAFALETLPLHFVGVPQSVRSSLQKFGQLAEQPLAAPSLAPFHRRRLQHSCRLLGLPAAPDSLWQQLDALRPELRQSATSELQIYSLRYFGSPAALQRWRDSLSTTASAIVATGADWALLRRPNPYLFPAATESRAIPYWAGIECVGIATELRDGQNSGQLWQAKGLLQVQQLQKLQGQKLQCEDLLCFGYCPQKGRVLLLEGVKTNVFLLRYDRARGILWLHTPQPQCGAAMLCGTTRNWLFQNFHRPQGNGRIRVICQNLGLSDLLQADGLLLCNAAMGLRTVRHLALPPLTDNSVIAQQLATYQNTGGKTCPKVNENSLWSCRLGAEALELFSQLLAMYWNVGFSTLPGGKPF